VCALFNIEDLFAAGIGFDIGGASLLALGLLTSPRQIADFMDWHGKGNAYLGLATVDDKINGESGVFFLVLGFLLQAAGYVVIAAFSPDNASGAWGVTGVIASVLLAFLMTALGARVWRWRRRIRVIREVSHYDHEPRLRMPLPLEFRLEAFAKAIEEEETGGEGAAGGWYDRRLRRYSALFGVNDFLAGSGAPDYQKATDLERATSSADAPTYAADEIGRRGDNTRGVKLIRRIFG
jgi:hypothetical protein